EDVRRRLIRVVALGNREYQTVAFQRRFDRAQRSRSTSRNRRGEARKDHGSAKRKDRKCLALSHSEYLFLEERPASGGPGVTAHTLFHGMRRTSAHSGTGCESLTRSHWAASIAWIGH